MPSRIKYSSVTFLEDVQFGVFTAVTGQTLSLPNDVARGLGSAVTINGPGSLSLIPAGIDPTGEPAASLANRPTGARQATLAVCGVSLESLSTQDIKKRFDCTAGSWANGVASLTSTAHGITVGTVFPADVYDHAGGGWVFAGANGATVTAVDANTFTFPAPINPGAIGGTVAVDIRVDKGIPITSATWTGGSATITLPIPLSLNSFGGADYRIELSNVRDSAGNLLAEYNAVIACAPTSFPATAQLVIYNTNDPGADAASGTIKFVQQYLGSSSPWIQALNSALGLPFRIVASFAVGGATPATVVNEVPQVLAMNPRPTHCLIGGVENDATLAATELFRAAGRTLRAAGVQPVFFDARPAGIFASAGVAFDAYQQSLPAMCEQEGFICLVGGNVYQRPGTSPVVDAYADTAWRKTPPSIDGTHDSRCGAYQIARALSSSDGGQKLRDTLRSRQAAMLGSNGKANLLPNPMWNVVTGGAIGGATGTVPGSWQIFGDNTPAVIFPIKRARPRKWMTSLTAVIGDVVFALTQSTPWLYVATAAGTASTTTEPTWPTSKGATVTDGTITWRAIDAAACDGKPGYWLGITVPRPTSLAITGVTQASPGVVSLNPTTGLANSRRVYIDGVVGMTQLNDRIWSVGGLAANTSFNLLRDDTNGNASTSGFGAWSSGGVVLPFTSVTLNLSAALSKATLGWKTRDRLKLSAEVVYEDVEAIRGANSQMAWLGVNAQSGESLGSALASQGYPLDQQTLGGEFMAPREMTAATQTLNPAFVFTLLSGTLRVASPRLENLGAW